MKSARSHTLSNCLVLLFSAAALFTAIASTASAQATPDLFTRVETLTPSDGTPARAPFRSPATPQLLAVTRSCMCSNGNRAATIGCTAPR